MCGICGSASQLEKPARVQPLLGWLARGDQRMKFRDRTAIVTGAASGIGRALASRLGREGVCVGLIDRDESGLETLRTELDGLGVRSASVVADVREREAVHAAVASLAGQLGTV